MHISWVNLYIHLAPRIYVVGENDITTSLFIKLVCLFSESLMIWCYKLKFYFYCCYTYKIIGTWFECMLVFWSTEIDEGNIYYNDMWCPLLNWNQSLTFIVKRAIILNSFRFLIWTVRSIQVKICVSNLNLQNDL